MPKSIKPPTALPAAEYCANCRFYRESSEVCRKAPPVVITLGGEVFSVRPIVEPDDWCGAHEPKGMRQ